MLESGIAHRGPIEGGSSPWVYKRSSGVWSQQAKLVGTGVIGVAKQGQSVSLSCDGNTAIVGGLAGVGSPGC